MKNYSRLFRLKKKKLAKIEEDTVSWQGKEREIKEVIQNSFREIFPNYTLLTSDPEYIIEDGHWANKRLDDLAFDEQKKTFVVLEYKSKIDKEQLDQARGYLNSLVKSKAEHYRLKDLWNRNLDVKKDFNWEEMKVVCISPKFTDKQYGSADEEKVFLVKIVKYKDEKGDIICFESNHEELFTKSKEKLKNIPKKKTTDKINTPKGYKKGKETEIPQKNAEKVDINQFLENWETDKQIKSGLLKINKLIFKSFKNSKVGRVTQIKKDGKYRYFFYCDNNNGIKPKGQVLYIQPSKTEGYRIYLREDEATADFDKHSFRKGGLPKSFTRRVNIKNKDDYQKLSIVLENYLKAVKEKLR